MILGGLPNDGFTSEWAAIWDALFLSHAVVNRLPDHRLLAFCRILAKILLQASPLMFSASRPLQLAIACEADTTRKAGRQ